MALTTIGADNVHERFVGRYEKIHAHMALSHHYAKVLNFNEAWALLNHEQQGILLDERKEYETDAKSMVYDVLPWFSYGTRAFRSSALFVSCLHPFACEFCKLHFYSLQEMVDLAQEFCSYSNKQIPTITFTCSLYNMNKMCSSHFDAFYILHHMYTIFRRHKEKYPHSLITTICIPPSLQCGRYITKIEWIEMLIEFQNLLNEKIAGIGAKKTKDLTAKFYYELQKTEDLQKVQMLTFCENAISQKMEEQEVKEEQQRHREFLTCFSAKKQKEMLLLGYENQTNFKVVPFVPSSNDNNTTSMEKCQTDFETAQQISSAPPQNSVKSNTSSKSISTLRSKTRAQTKTTIETTIVNIKDSQMSIHGIECMMPSTVSSSDHATSALLLNAALFATEDNISPVLAPNKCKSLCLPNSDAPNSDALSHLLSQNKRDIALVSADPVHVTELKKRKSSCLNDLAKSQNCTDNMNAFANLETIESAYHSQLLFDFCQRDDDEEKLPIIRLLPFVRLRPKSRKKSVREQILLIVRKLHKLVDKLKGHPGHRQREKNTQEYVTLCLRRQEDKVVLQIQSWEAFHEESRRQMLIT